MDLKIKDVAELLHVSEITIRRWVSGGQIPAYRLNHQYRFNRFEIENWMMGCKLKKGKDFSAFGEKESESLPVMKGGTQQFSLYRALNKGGVLTSVPGKSKEEVIRNSAKVSSAMLGLDSELLTELLIDRENLMSTALNHGVAVPHPREFILKGSSDAIVVAFPEESLDFEALDGLPVHTLFFLFSTQDKKHLHLLAKIAHLSSSPEALEFLRLKPTKEELLSFVKSWESKMS